MEIESKTLAVFVFLIAMSLVFSNLINSQYGFELAQFPTGWTTLSLTQAHFSSTSSFFKDKTFILTVAQGGMGQHAEGTITPSEVKAKSGVQPKNNLKIAIDYSKANWEYPIKVDYTSTPVYHYELYYIQSWNPFFDVQSWARQKCQHLIWYGKIGGLPPTYYCIDRIRKTSYLGYLDNCNFHFVTTIKVSSNSETYQKTIDSKSQISTYIGPYVYVIWNGNLLKQSCPSQQPYKPFYMNGWKLGSQEDYLNYKTKENYFESQMRLVENQQTSWSIHDMQVMINDVNLYADKFTSQSVSFGTINNPYDITKAYVSLPVSTDVQVPIYTFCIKASWIGIYQPIPQPQVIDARGASFKSGEYGYLYVKFKNVGESGNIVVWAKCQNPIDVLDSAKTFSVKKDYVQVAYIRIGYNGNEHVSAMCNIYLQGQGSNNVISKTVSVSADPQKVCEPNQMICEAQTIKQCNQYGTGWNLVKQCSNNEYCTYINGLPSCVKHEPAPSPTPIQLPKFNVFNLLMIVLIIIIVILIVKALT